LARAVANLAFDLDDIVRAQASLEGRSGSLTHQFWSQLRQSIRAVVTGELQFAPVRRVSIICGHVTPLKLVDFALLSLHSLFDHFYFFRKAKKALLIFTDSLLTEGERQMCTVRHIAMVLLKVVPCGGDSLWHEHAESVAVQVKFMSAIHSLLKTLLGMHLRAASHRAI